MKKISISIMIVVLALIVIAPAIVLAQEVTGTVTSVSRRTVEVRCDDGSHYTFYVGRRTAYSPQQRQPAIGEVVSVQYINDRGYLKATNIRIGGGSSGGVPSSGSTATVQRPYSGRKARIGVANFRWGAGRGSSVTTVTDSSGRTVTVDHQGYMTGLRDMLATALHNSGRFQLLERSEMSAIKSEMLLTEDGYAEKKGGVKKGRIKSADLLIVATVSGWEPNASGIGGRVRLPGPFRSRVGVGVKTAIVVLDVRIFDARTSEVLAAQEVRGQARDFGIVTGAAFPMSGSLGVYKNTPMEKAIRLCIVEAVNYIASSVPSRYYKH